jgi:uncharacterized secreted repeat protein (TIGR03808 family)
MVEICIPRTRRRLLRGVARAAAALPFYRSLVQAQADPIAGTTMRLTEDLALAALRRRPFVLPRGLTRIYRISLPEGAHLIAAPGGSILQLAYDGPMIANRAPLNQITLENIAFDGANRPINDAFGLLSFNDVAEVVVENCVFRNATIGLFQRRCGGKLRLCQFHDLTDTAIYNDHCRGFVIDANRIERCGNNGIHHWGDKKSGQHDGTRISSNTIVDIDNRRGGEGLWGNGVRVAETGPVTIENNVVERCAYSAIRNTGGWDVAVANNRCKSLNETAMYAEFGFRDATFRDNVISDCAAGISATNYLGPGDGDRALLEGNIITGLRPSHPNPLSSPRGFMHGIHGEGDVRMVGNTVVGSPTVAALAGFYNARHDVTVEDNHLIDNEYAIGFATQDGIGPCAIRRNEIRGSKKANIVAMFQEHVISGDVSAPGAASAYKDIEIRDNRIS